jgi:hypothetical protein
VRIARNGLSFTLREEHRLREFGNRALMRMFGPKRDEAARGWRKLHNELHNCYLHQLLLGLSHQE